MNKVFFMMKGKGWDCYDAIINKEDLQTHIAYVKKNSGLQKVHYKLKEVRG